MLTLFLNIYTAMDHKTSYLSGALSHEEFQKGYPPMSCRETLLAVKTEMYYVYVDVVSLARQTFMFENDFPSCFIDGIVSML